MRSNYLDELNDIQRQAVTNTSGPVMVIAGPGSGKTRVLTYRIAHLIEKGVDPFRILSLTFTNKAAKEMRERIEHVIGGEARNVWMGTFHSIFARILRQEATKIGYPSNFTIYDSSDSKNVVKQIVKELELNDKLYKPSTVFNRISAAKNNLIGPQKYREDKYLVSDDSQSGRPKIAEIYALYAKKCFQSGAMDFDDLLFKMYELLSTHPEVLHKYQHKFNYILVDEYQDTNFAQYLITKRLAAVHENITVVGDDAQSIYSFRGADIQNILNFEKDYPDMRTFKLEQNYRSTTHIVEAANQIIALNKNQLPKTIWTDRQGGDKIKVVKAVSDNEEGRIVADTIFEYQMRLHLRSDDFAILYRTNAQSRSFEEALRRQNIPYKVFGGLSFYQRKEIKDLLAYLKLTVNHNDEEALRRIINYPTRGIGDTTLDRATVLASERSTNLWSILSTIQFQPDFNARAKNLIEEFVMMIKSFATMLQTMNAYDLASHIAKHTGIVKELYTDKTVEGISRYENIQELLNGIKEFSESDEIAEGETVSDRSLGTYLQDIMLLTDTESDKDDTNRVSLMSIHSAKGLEFECVFAVGLEEGLFPNQMSVNSREELEEERRLYYVAVTRAKSHLFLTYALQRYRFGNLIYSEPSRFIEELDEKNLEFIGHKVRRAEPTSGPDTPWERSGTRTTKEAPGKSLYERPGAAQRQATPNYTPAAHTPSADFKADDPKTIQAGMEVEHEKFGIGKVVSLEGDGNNRIATLFFAGIGQKRIMLKYAKVRIVSGGAE
jgi:DNA helicase-2/ATP-dependent DNA helicase PcrA